MKDKIIMFLWQHLLLLLSLFIMTFGVAVCVRSALGSSVISTNPYVFELAGKKLSYIPEWTIGQYTILMNALFVVCQIFILRKEFEPVQLCQALLGFVFGTLIDVNMFLTSWLVPINLLEKIVAQVIGCTILGAGIALEVRCGSITMPGEGLPIAISRVSGMEFPKVKIRTDISLVILAVIFSFAFLGSWQWQIVGVGTLFAMVYVGMVVRTLGKYLGWFDRILAYRPGFRRYIYGLLRHIRS